MSNSPSENSEFSTHLAAIKMLLMPYALEETNAKLTNALAKLCAVKSQHNRLAILDDLTSIIGLVGGSLGADDFKRLIRHYSELQFILSQRHLTNLGINDEH